MHKRGIGLQGVLWLMHIYISQIYEWGGEGYDGLGDRLDEAGDDLNDDTFGMGAGDVGKDFDFGHGPSAQAPSAAPTQRQQKPVDSMFASNFDDFWAVPSISRPPQQQQQQPSPLPQQPAPARRHKTMEEIEAELRASSLSQHQQPQQHQQQQPAPARRPKTMDNGRTMKFPTPTMTEGSVLSQVTFSGPCS